MEIDSIGVICHISTVEIDSIGAILIYHNSPHKTKTNRKSQQIPNKRIHSIHHLSGLHDPLTAIIIETAQCNQLISHESWYVHYGMLPLIAIKDLVSKQSCNIWSICLLVVWIQFQRTSLLIIAWQTLRIVHMSWTFLLKEIFFFGKIAERDWLSSFNSLDPFFFPGLMHWFLACMNLLTALASYTNCLILLVQNSDSQSVHAIGHLDFFRTCCIWAWPRLF